MIKQEQMEEMSKERNLLNQEIEAMKYFANKNAVSMFDIVKNCEHKEKQITEMAKDYYGDSIDLEEDCKCVAEEMYDKGHRKLPDGAVVLLIGENNQALDEKTIEYFVKHNEQIRKETAREILKKVFKKDNLVSDEGYDESGFWSTLTYYIDAEEAREIEREYDVEVEE